jgi:hypothetical protein
MNSVERAANLFIYGTVYAVLISLVIAAATGRVPVPAAPPDPRAGAERRGARLLPGARPDPRRARPGFLERVLSSRSPPGSIAAVARSSCTSAPGGRRGPDRGAHGGDVHDARHRPRPAGPPHLVAAAVALGASSARWRRCRRVASAAAGVGVLRAVAAALSMWALVWSRGRRSSPRCSSGSFRSRRIRAWGKFPGRNRTTPRGPTMAFELPALPYAQDALAPHISAETLEFHYGKHHQTYVTNLNKLVEGTEFENAELEDVIMKSDGGAVQQRRARCGTTPSTGTRCHRRRRCPDRRGRRRDQLRVRLLRRLPRQVRRGGHHPVRLRLGLAGRLGLGPRGHEDLERRPADEARRQGAAHHRRVGARLLHRLPQRPAELHLDLHRQPVNWDFVAQNMAAEPVRPRRWRG